MQMEQRKLPPRFLREPENPFNLEIEPPIIMNFKRLLDDKSSEESSEITTEDDSEDTLEEFYNYYGSRDYGSYRFGRMEVDSNNGEENFSDTSGPVITLPEREPQESQENPNPEILTYTPEASSTIVEESSSTEFITESTTEISSTYNTESSSENTEIFPTTESESSTELKSVAVSTGRSNSRRLELSKTNYIDRFKTSEQPKIENFHLFSISLASDY